MEWKEIDTTLAARGLWLVKVPKYISEKWEAAAETGKGDEVGKIRIVQAEKGKEQEVTLILPEHLLQQEASASTSSSKTSAVSQKIPQEHKFTLARPAQTMGVFSHESPAPRGEESEEALDENGVPRVPKPFDPKLRLEGHVIRRAECRPIISTNYMQMKKKQIESSQKPKRSVQHINTIVNTYKPVSTHANLVEYEAKKDGPKKARADKDKVQEMLFSAFEKHQYYSLKDLVRITQQPITYLKEILHELCNYNMKAPHKNMWELKPEFRHYKAEED